MATRIHPKGCRAAANRPAARAERRFSRYHEWVAGRGAPAGEGQAGQLA